MADGEAAARSETEVTVLQGAGGAAGNNGKDGCLNEPPCRNVSVSVVNRCGEHNSRVQPELRASLSGLKHSEAHFAAHAQRALI